MPSNLFGAPLPGTTSSLCGKGLSLPRPAALCTLVGILAEGQQEAVEEVDLR